MIRVAVLGDYAHRQPLAYAQIRARCLRDIRVEADPARADIVAVAHSKDLDSHAATLRGLGAGQTLVLLSEEPFWDTIWGHDPTRRDLVHPAPDGPLAAIQLNHRTSTIYRFKRIPYFLLTEGHFRTRYRHWFARNAARSEASWQAHFAQVPGQAAFMAARRHSPRYDVDFPGTPLRSLSNLRTRIAEACGGHGTVRLGRGWEDGAIRQDLTDWHLQKYLALAGGYRFVSALENTHDPDYVTEKLFDAYAAGSIPLYLAGPGHRVHELAGTGSWLNLWETDPAEVPGRMRAFETGAETADAYAAQQRRLAALFASADAWEAEYDRLKAALVAEFTTVLG
ncbi:MAG: glycosyltransferase family 10 domain-containing protein [Pseudooceanicola nanhaiensis]|uniref:glycosyltransferase family 10 domain-containing protein n=1 Tax=Pseudooceanicola nanhaiensis TaxID=375761 RepID=UPI004058067B